jgi:hypothetical protein
LAGGHGADLAALTATVVDGRAKPGQDGAGYKSQQILCDFPHPGYILTLRTDFSWKEGSMEKHQMITM